MLALTNPTRNRLFSHLLLRHNFLHSLGFEVLRETQGDVLADRGGRRFRSGGVALLSTEFGPLLACDDARVDVLLHDGGADGAGVFDLLAGGVDAVGYGCFGAIGIFDGLGRREGGGEGEVVVVVGPGRVGHFGNCGECVAFVRSDVSGDI